MALDQGLLEILACPDQHHAPLDYDPAGQTLTCTECGRIFEVRDDVPVLLLDEARQGPAAPAAPGGDSGAGGPSAGAVGGTPTGSGDDEMGQADR